MSVTVMDQPHPGMGFREFVCLVAALMATNALAIDSMLPALPLIGNALGVKLANERQWIITSYLLGFGSAQIFYGTLADRYGRKPLLVWGLAAYAACALLVPFCHSYTAVLIARVIEGISAASTRVISVSVVRDCYSGRLMARVMSLSFIVFLAVPILAPSIGQLIMLVASWQWIFGFLCAFGTVTLLWVLLRLPETLHEEDRTPIEIHNVLKTFKFILSNRYSFGYTLAMTLVFGGLLGFINSAQQLFTIVFKEPRYFTLIFAVIAGFIALASVVNARLVDRLGMRLLSHSALLSFIGLAVIHFGIAISGLETIWSFTILQSLMMFCFGLLVGNFGALAMEPLGHVAGTAASVQGFMSTVGGALIGFMIGQCFNNTDIPLVLGFAVCGSLGLLVVLVVEHGRLFRRSPAYSG
jgi:DHA1 family bicyclomycin/chloramphenicol resistance-like MFS transporter